MDRKVTVLTPNGRRHNVKVTPNTTLLEILEETCKKFGFESDEYGLKHHNKEVGLSQMFRFSGLPNNCLLEMAEIETKRVTMDVDICIQLEDGRRVQGKFVPSDNLWHVVEHLEPKATAQYKNPIAIYMRKEVVGREQMASTTLKSLGIIEGRAMIRFINKNPEELKMQANVYKAPTPKETPKVENENLSKGPRLSKSANTTANEKSSAFSVTKDTVKLLKKDPTNTTETPSSGADQQPDSSSTNKETAKPAVEKPKYDWGTGTGHTIRGNTSAERSDTVRTQLDPETQDDEEIEPEINIIGERSAIIYSLDSTQKQVENLPDSFFDLTVHDLKLVLRDLKRTATGNEDAPLLTEKLRELEENKTMLNKIAMYKNCVIRIQFPNRYVLQGLFKPIDTVTEVAEFVRSFLQDPERKFILFTIPPKVILPEDKTLLELNFVPTALLHFAYDDCSPPCDPDLVYVKPVFLEKLTTVEGALFAANKLRIANRKLATLTSDSDITQSFDGKANKPGPSTGAIPKRPRSDDLQQRV